MPFFCIHILQGSVATRLKRGGIFKHEFVNLLLSRLVKKFWKSVNSLWSYGQEFGVLFFLTHGVEEQAVHPLDGRTQNTQQLHSRIAKWASVAMFEW